MAQLNNFIAGINATEIMKPGINDFGGLLNPSIKDENNIVNPYDRDDIVIITELAQANWAMNDAEDKHYVANRTHWIDEQGNYHLLDAKFIPASYVDEETETLCLI